MDSTAKKSHGQEDTVAFKFRIDVKSTGALRQGRIETSSQSQNGNGSGQDES